MNKSTLKKIKAQSKNSEYLKGEMGLLKMTKLNGKRENIWKIMVNNGECQEAGKSVNWRSS